MLLESKMLLDDRLAAVVRFRTCESMPELWPIESFYKANEGGKFRPDCLIVYLRAFLSVFSFCSWTLMRSISSKIVCRSKCLWFCPGKKYYSFCLLLCTNGDEFDMMDAWPALNYSTLLSNYEMLIKMFTLDLLVSPVLRIGVASTMDVSLMLYLYTGLVLIG